MERLFMARVPKWLRTHPQTGERVRRLLALEREGGFAERELELGPLYEPPVEVRAPRWYWPGLWY